MFLSGEKAWKTRVDYNKIRMIEQGDVDPEKIASYTHTGSISSKAGESTTEETK